MAVENSHQESIKLGVQEHFLVIVNSSLQLPFPSVFSCQKHMA